MQNRRNDYDRGPNDQGYNRDEEMRSASSFDRDGGGGDQRWSRGSQNDQSRGRRWTGEEGVHGDSFGGGFSNQGYGGYDASMRAGGGGRDDGGGGYGYGREQMRGRGSVGVRSDMSNMPGTRGMSGMQQGGMHRGKGPKGFKRSDERIREQVCEALADHHEIDATEIDVTVKDGEITLSGTVEDRRTKHLVEEVIEQLSGVHDFQNNIRVQRQQSSGDRTSTDGSRTSITSTAGQNASSNKDAQPRSAH